jgi:microcystin degradation protein MlrC
MALPSATERLMPTMCALCASSGKAKQGTGAGEVLRLRIGHELRQRGISLVKLRIHVFEAQGIEEQSQSRQSTGRASILSIQSISLTYSRERAKAVNRRRPVSFF